MSAPRGERGFSLIELILVIVVIGILAVVVSPSATIFPEMKLRAATERVVSDLHYAQAYSRQEGGPVGLSFDAGLKKYTVVHTTALVPEPDPLQPTKSLVFDTGSDSRFTGITFTWDLPSNNSVLLFDSIGQPRDDLYEVALTPAVITLHLNAGQAVITVEAVTGRVSSAVTP